MKRELIENIEIFTIEAWDGARKSSDSRKIDSVTPEK